MSRKFVIAVLPLAVLAVVSPEKGVAGPPQAVPGKMVLDEVYKGLRMYDREETWDKRVAWLKRLAPRRDPRVAVALGEALNGCLEELRLHKCLTADGVYAYKLLCQFYLTAEDKRVYAGNDGDPSMQAVGRWWKQNKAELTRRAAKLPR